MKKNGFTLVELLAVITIIGILAGVAIPVTYIYINKARKNNYNTMESSSQTAAENYFLSDGHNGEILGKKCVSVPVAKLVSEDYLEKMIDPKNNNVICSGKVWVYNESVENGSALDNYKYYVQIRCDNYYHTFMADGKTPGGYKEFPGGKYVDSLPSGC